MTTDELRRIARDLRDRLLRDDGVLDDCWGLMQVLSDYLRVTEKGDAEALMCEETRLLREEVARLKRGDLTPEEFHALCHNLHERVDRPCTRKEFDAECEKFADQLFDVPGDTGRIVQWNAEQTRHLRERLASVEPKPDAAKER